MVIGVSSLWTHPFQRLERPGDASSVFSVGGEKPPEIIDTTGQDEDDSEDAMVLGFGGGAWWGKDEDGGGAPNEGGGGHLAEYPDDDFIPGFATSDVASRPNGHEM
jgi:polyadenylation factor subunit 2